MKIRTTSLTALALGIVAVSAISANAADRPNIVLIMADDNDQISWTIGGNCCEFLCFVGVSGEFQTAVVSGEFTGNWGY